jgi:hypothetical protein
MSYVGEVTNALVKVLTHAADGSEEKFAGYAANRAFWVDEVRHCLDLIDGYWQRFEWMRKASQAHSTWADIWVPARITAPSTRNDELRALKHDLLHAARRFLRRCVKIDSRASADVARDAVRLGLTPPI